MLSIKKIKSVAVALIAALGISIGSSSVANASALDLQIQNTMNNEKAVHCYYYDDDYGYRDYDRRHHRHRHREHYRDRHNDDAAGMAVLGALLIAAAVADS